MGYLTSVACGLMLRTICKSPAQNCRKRAVTLKKHLAADWMNHGHWMNRLTSTNQISR